MEPMVAKLISLLHNGFISGRKILDNFLEIDVASMTVSIGEGQARSYFLTSRPPSPASHNHFYTILKISGLPPHIRL
eukprot:15101834-Heterocapsa_arctica.AAC.1